MRGLDTILGSKLNTSIDMNGLFVPANSLSDYLQRFTDPALYHAHDLDEFQLSKSGSLFRIKYRERYFAITSHHQSKRGGYQYDELVLIGKERNWYYTGHKAIFPVEEQESEYEFDCLIYEFTDLVEAEKLSSSNWFSVNEISATRTTPKPLIVCTIGYPSHRNNIDYSQKSYPIGPNAVWGTEAKSNIRNRLAFTPKPTIDFEPSGMSGAPVFAVERDGELLFGFCAGILTEATRKKFNFIPLNKLKRALDHAIR